MKGAAVPQRLVAGRPLIEGVRTKHLNVIPDERGRLMEILRRDDDCFVSFGQAYMTTAYPGVVKGWHYHRVQIDHFVVLQGMMKVVLYDPRKSSSTRGVVNEFFLGDHNPILVQIPAFVYHGLKCISDREAILLNLPSEPYRHEAPDEYRVAAHDPSIPYDWSRQDR